MWSGCLDVPSGEFEVFQGPEWSPWVAEEGAGDVLWWVAEGYSRWLGEFLYAVGKVFADAESFFGLFVAGLFGFAGSVIFEICRVPPAGVVGVVRMFFKSWVLSFVIVEWVVLWIAVWVAVWIVVGIVVRIVVRIVVGIVVRICAGCIIRFRDMWAFSGWE